MGTDNVATFGAGCFWGVQLAFDREPGVIETAVGFMGGDTPHPTYREVCGGRTGHAEVVHVTFDPARTAYARLLELFFSVHNPTERDRQGPDVGSQYRSVIFTHSDEQARMAREAVDSLDRAGRFARPIATEIAPAGEFWRAEEHHQKYLEKHGRASCGLQ